jgi:shikimate dehydrogenase
LPERGLPALPARGVHAHQHPRRADHDAAQGRHRGAAGPRHTHGERGRRLQRGAPRADGALEGDLFDGEGFVRGVSRKGLQLAGARALVVGAGGVGCAIAASLAAAGVGAIALHDRQRDAVDGLAARLRVHYPAIEVCTGSNDPAGFDLVVNATPMGMNAGDPLPLDVSRLEPSTFVGEVVMRTEMTAFLQAAQARGCPIQVGSDMLFEQIPAYLEFFGYPSTTAEVLRSVARFNA